MRSDREEGEENARPSKTRLKKQMLELQALGAALVALPEHQVSTLPLSDNLRAAIRDYARIPTHGGRRRQMQYIGKLMRGVDAEPIRAAVEALDRSREANSAKLHEAERWRTRLIEDDEALAEWAARHPAGDLEKLRGLVRAARAVAPEQRRRRAQRELFRFIRSELSAS